jgi:hypothetical protein
MYDAAGAGHAAGYSPLIARLSAVGHERASALYALNSTGPMLAEVHRPTRQPVPGGRSEVDTHSHRERA